jgi:hypothetical protein
MNNQKKVFYSHCALPYFGQWILWLLLE